MEHSEHGDVRLIPQHPMRFWMKRIPKTLRPLTGAILILSAAACTEAELPRPAAQMAPDRSEQFFAAAVSYLARTSRAPVRVDPRPLRPETRLDSVSAADIMAGDTATIRLRTAALVAAAVPLADATRDWPCVFSDALRGPPPGQRGGTDPVWEQIRAAEPDSVRGRREACRRNGEFTSLIFGPPQPGTDPANPGWWRIRSMRMMLHGWEIADLFLEREADGDWLVVREQVRTGAFS